MARKRSTAEQIIGKLREAEVALAQGDPVAKVARRLGVTEQTSYRWRREDGGRRVDQAKRRKALERANAWRKRLVADQARDNAIVKAVTAGDFCARRAGGRRSCTCEPSCPSRSVGRVGLLAQPRRTQRRPARVARDEPALIARLIALARRFGRYGSRRITALLRAEGWRVNHKRVAAALAARGAAGAQQCPAAAAALDHRWLLHASPGGAAEPRLVRRLRPRADARRSAPALRRRPRPAHGALRAPRPGRPASAPPTAPSVRPRLSGAGSSSSA